MKQRSGHFTCRWVGSLGTLSRRVGRLLNLFASRRAKARAASVELQVDVAAAFARRAWPDFGSAVDALAKADPPAAAYWRLRQDDFLQIERRPSEAWSRLYQALHGSGHRLAASALEGVLRSAILGEAPVERVLEILSCFQRRHGSACPLSLLPATCTWLLRRGRPRDALLLAETAIDAQSDPRAKATARLRTCTLRLACEQQARESPDALPSEGSPYTAALRTEMQEFPAGSIAAAVFAAAEECWTAISLRPACHAHDLRFIEAQRQGLVTRIADALRQRRPLALVRLGDADSYGFPSPASLRDERSDLEQEELWWGKALTELQRERAISGFKEALGAADIVGFPYLHRLARDLVVDERVNPNPREEKLLRLFRGMAVFCATRTEWQADFWADEYCNFTLAAPEVLGELRNLSRNVVLVTGFSTRSGLPAQLEGATVVEIPPHVRSSGAGSRVFGSRILPEVVDEVAERVGRLAEPGVLVLVCAGFAGKELLWAAKRSGAVALDLGSAIDPMFGQRTRAVDLYIA